MGMKEIYTETPEKIKTMFGLEGIVDSRNGSNLRRLLNTIKFYQDGTIQEIVFIYLEDEE